MSFSLDSKGPMSDINVTPLVDVMLVLLIIFMITAPKLTQGVEVELPQTNDAEPVTGDDDRLMLTLTQAGEVYLGSTLIPTDRIADVLSENAKLKADGELFLHADHRLPYGDVVAVMASAKKGGATSIAMVTDPVANAPAKPAGKKKSR